MKRQDRYDLPSRPSVSGQRRLAQTAKSSPTRFLTPLFVIAIILGAGLLIAPRFLPAQPSGPNGAGNGGGTDVSLFTLPVKSASANANANVASPATALPAAVSTQVVIVGSTSPDPDVIRRDYVPNGSTGSAVTSRSVKRELTTYTVIDGDTLFGIALKVGLRPETVLWSNYKTLKDNPDLLSIGQVLTIPPDDGLILDVEQGDTIDGLARRFGVPVETISGEPINSLSDANQSLSIGQVIYVPGGQRETVVWQVPKPIATGKIVKGAKVYQVGRCGEVAIPQLGSGNFSWPESRHYLSGYNFSVWHAGLDIAGHLGEPIFAADAGTVIYAGFSLNTVGQPVGYGQYVVLDHGNGYQTLYAHASQLYVKCGQQVRRGVPIAAVGSIGKSTGPHLHFEIRLNGGAVNPWTLLP